MMTILRLFILLVSTSTILVGADIGSTYDKLFTLQHARGKKVQKLIHLSRDQAVNIAQHIQEHGTTEGYYQRLDEKMPSDITADGELIVSNRSQQAESELSAALNPTDTSQWVVSPINQSFVQTSGFMTPIYYTNDFGVSWSLSPFEAVPSSSTSFMLGGGDPVFTFSKNGRCVFTWLSLELNGITQEAGIKMYWAYSNNGGATWTRPQADVVDEGDVSTTFVDKQWMATDISNTQHSGNVYCVYTVLSADLEITLKRLESGSDTWSEKVALYGPEYDFRFLQFSSIDTDMEGKVHVTFVGMEAGATTGALYYTVSNDGGKTFAELEIISEFHTPRIFQNGNSFNVNGINPDRMYPCPHIALDKSDGPYAGTAYAAWTANGIESIGNKGMDVFYSYKRPGGTWTSPKQVHDVDDATSQFYSSVAVSGRGEVVVAWYDQRNGPQNTHYRMAVSRNGGESFGTSFELSTAPTNFPSIGNQNNGFGIGEYNQIMTTDYYAIPVWADGRKNNGDIDLYAATVNLETSSVDDYRLVEDKLSLLGVYPNPVNGNSVAVEFKTEEPVTADLIVTSMTGEVVLELGEMQLQPGVSTINVDVSNLASGSYRLVAQTSIGAVSASLVKIKD